MADSVSTFPPGFDAYAGYGNGRYRNMDELRQQFPHKPALEIDVLNAGIGDVLDIEKGDAVPADAPGWARRRQKAGVKRPVLYASLSDMPAIFQWCAKAGLNRSEYRLWSAHWTYRAHICNPRTCHTSLHFDGTQYTDKGGGGKWDESLLRADFFGPRPSPSVPGWVRLARSLGATIRRTLHGWRG